MIYESFLHTNDSGEFFICLKNKSEYAGEGQPMWFGPFETEEQAVQYAGRLHDVINDEMIKRGATPVAADGRALEPKREPN